MQEHAAAIAPVGLLRLFRRRSTGEVIERDRKGGAVWTRFAFPTWWHYDVLRGLEYLRRAGVAPDERVAEAIDLVASKREENGLWPLETQYPGEMPVETFGRQLAFNIIPEHGLSCAIPGLEGEIARQVAHILGWDRERLTLRFLAAPLFYGHGVELHLRTPNGVGINELRSA